MSEIWVRDDLYREVWAEPITRVAERYGVSGNAIAKVCRKLKIPVPGRGYWAKKSAGQDVALAVLPPMKDVPQLFKPVPTPSKAVQPPDAEYDAIDRQKASGLFAWPEGQIPEHALVREAKRLLTGQKEDAFHHLERPWGKKCLKLKASTQLLTRALAVMNAVIFLLERNGAGIAINKNDETVATFPNSVEVQFDIREQVHQVSTGKSGYGERVTYVSTGLLALEIREYVKEVRQLWKEKPGHGFERETFPEVVAAILKSGIAIRRRQEQWRQRELEEQRRAREAQARAEAAQREKEKLDRLIRDVANWKLAREIREYLDALATRTKEQSQELQEWIAWAQGQANNIDPLTTPVDGAIAR